MKLRSESKVIWLIVGQLLFGLSGCSSHQAATPLEKLAAEDGAGEAPVAQPPLDIEIGQAFVHDESLHVKVYVRAQHEIPTSDVNVTLRGLKEGMLLGEKVQMLKESMSEQSLKPGDVVALNFEMPVEGLTEYQVKCSWGDEAKQPGQEPPSSKPSELVLKDALPQESDILAGVASAPEAEIAPETSSSPEALKGELELADLEAKREELPCTAPPCDLQYMFHARLKNSSNTAVESVRLALAIMWVNDGESPSFPPPLTAKQEGEELIELSGLTLSPGTEKKIRVKVDKDIPSVPGGSFIPYLRLLDYASK